MTSSPHGPYVLGYTRYKYLQQEANSDVKQIKRYLGSDYTLQLECMKLVLVIVDQRATGMRSRVLYTLGSHHGVGSTLRQGLIP